MAKDPREYGYEGEMAMSQLKGIMMHANQLHDMLEPDTDLPEWVQSKITLAYDYIQTAADYMSTEMNEETKWVKNKHGSGYTSSDGKREIVKHPKGWISRSTTDRHDYSDVFPTQKEAKAGKYAWAMKNEEAVSESKEFYADAKKRAKADLPQEKLSSTWKAKAKARASAAGRKYPNLVDNVWAARMQESVNEEAPANSVGGGKIAGMGVGPQGEPGVGPKAMKRYKDKNAAAAPKAGRKTLSIFMQGK